MGEGNSTIRARWLKQCNQLSLDGSSQWLRFETAYQSPDRAYHNLQHIRDCLSQLDHLLEMAENPMVLEFAIWFHDFIYDTRVSDNELKSAEAAKLFLQGTDIAQVVYEVIVATRHNLTSINQNAQLMCDIDLSILGSDPTKYQTYAESIRKEYSWVDEISYREGRTQVLKSFLERKQIYHLAPLQQRYEAQARLNLQHEIDQLNP